MQVGMAVVRQLSRPLLGADFVEASDVPELVGGDGESRPLLGADFVEAGFDGPMTIHPDSLGPFSGPTS